jgi:uncharacterized damage-inducible protein DinB
MENTVLKSKKTNLEATVLTSEMLLAHWQGHRRLTRKVIEAFPEDKLFSYSLGGLRPFADLAMEMMHMGAPGVRGAVTREWPTWQELEQEFKKPGTKTALLNLWDKGTEQINELWPEITPQRFQEVDKVFGQYEGTIYWGIFYFIDNEIHHRGQGYVYLRSLGIEPPAFWDRS